MIARGTIGTKELLTLGLSRKNVERLMAGQPIQIKRDTHGQGVPDGWEILILFGETEDSFLKALHDAGAIGPKTKINRDPKLDQT